MPRITLLVTLTAAFAFASASGACVDTEESWWESDTWWEDSRVQDYKQDNLDVRQGRLAGDFGGVRVGAGSFATVEGYDDSYFASVSVMATSSNGASMGVLEVYDGSSLSVLTSGTYALGSGVSLTGCAGPWAYEWDADTVADAVTVTVTPSPQDPAVRTIAFNGTFTEYDGGQSTLSGQFDLRVSDR